MLAICLAAMIPVANAQEQGRVISSQPVIQQVAVPRQVCSNQQVVVEAPKTGAGGIMGAIAGAAVGNNIGAGSGKALATMIGFIGGAATGDRIEGAPPSQVQTVQNCTTQTFYENRTISYNVVYEFGGKQYQTQMPTDPGQFVQLQVTPVATPAVPVQAAPMPVQNQVQPQVIQQPQVVIQSAPVFVATPQVVYAQPQVVYQQPTVVYQRPYYPVQPQIHLGFGWNSGFHHIHGPRYWNGYRRWH
jgi:uncharacterized protein YcfJ